MMEWKFKGFLQEHGLNFALDEILSEVRDRPYNENILRLEFYWFQMTKDTLQTCLTCTANPDGAPECLACIVSAMEHKYHLRKIFYLSAQYQYWRMKLEENIKETGVRTWQLCDLTAKLLWLRDRQGWIEWEVEKAIQEFKNKEINLLRIEERETIPYGPLLCPATIGSTFTAAEGGGQMV